MPRDRDAQPCASNGTLRSPWFPVRARSGSGPSPPARPVGRRSPGDRCRSRCSSGSNPTPSSRTSNRSIALAVRKDDLRLGRLGVLRDVLQGLEAREVHGRLDVLAVPFHALAMDPDRDRALAAPVLRARSPGPCRPAAAGRCRGRAGEGSRARRSHPPARPRASPSRRRGREPVSCCASRTLTLNATSCCCAPSCRFRSSRRRSSSCAATRRCRDALSSSINRTLRSTRPACDARSPTNLRRAGSRGSFAGVETESAPSSSPWWRTSTTRSSGIDGSVSPGAATARGGSPPLVAAGRSSPPTRNHTVAVVAPVAPARISAIRGRTSSVA